MLPSRSGILAEAINTKILTKNHPDSPYPLPDCPHSHPYSLHSHPYSLHSHPDSAHSHLHSPHSHSHSSHSHPDSPHSHLYSPHSYPGLLRSHHSPHSAPRFPISAFTDSLYNLYCLTIRNSQNSQKISEVVNFMIIDGNQIIIS